MTLHKSIRWPWVCRVDPISAVISSGSYCGDSALSYKMETREAHEEESQRRNSSRRFESASARFLFVSTLCLCRWIEKDLCWDSVLLCSDPLPHQAVRGFSLRAVDFSCFAQHGSCNRLDQIETVGFHDFRIFRNVNHTSEWCCLNKSWDLIMSCLSWIPLWGERDGGGLWGWGWWLCGGGMWIVSIHSLFPALMFNSLIGNQDIVSYSIHFDGFKLFLALWFWKLLIWCLGIDFLVVLWEEIACNLRVPTLSRTWHHSACSSVIHCYVWIDEISYYQDGGVVLKLWLLLPMFDDFIDEKDLLLDYEL